MNLKLTTLFLTCIILGLSIGYGYGAATACEPEGVDLQLASKLFTCQRICVLGIKFVALVNPGARTLLQLATLTPKTDEACQNICALQTVQTAVTDLLKEKVLN
jgi:hypothetical protein